LLQQYGAVGVVAAGLLSLMIWIVKRLVDATLDQNKLLRENSDRMITAMGEIKAAIVASQQHSSSQIRDLHIDVAAVLNDMTAVGRRVTRTRGGTPSS
jgi:hypothetical protein